MKLASTTRAALFAEWRKLSPSLTFEGDERQARIDWANARLGGAKSRRSQGPALQSWSELTEAQARFLLRKMREESGDGAAYRAMLCATLAAELRGSDWDDHLHHRLGERFCVGEAADLEPAQAHALIEELLERIARRDGIEVEAARAKYARARVA